jgi:hypothetical protein
VFFVAPSNNRASKSDIAQCSRDRCLMRSSALQGDYPSSRFTESKRTWNVLEMETSIPMFGALLTRPLDHVGLVPLVHPIAL